MLGYLPEVNACLNATSAFLLVCGYAAIRRRAVGLHKAFMVAAVLTSTLFLGSYLTYHAMHGSTRFQLQGTIRMVYFTVLASHTLLAALVLPLVLVTLYRAAREDWLRHAALARWTFPIWLYVSVTGVVVYWMLYQLPGAAIR
jgi:putative membrane protein